ncbi:MAG: HlyD family efflux transporter periplasmic adaptor subunit [Planctomycetota bacterium]
MSTNDSVSSSDFSNPSFEPVVPPTDPPPKTPGANKQKPADERLDSGSAALPPALNEAQRLVNQARKMETPHVPPGPSGDGPIDHQLVSQTRDQIRLLVQEISNLAKSDISRDEFFAGFLTRTVSALASIGGAIWLKETDDSPLQLQYQINMKQTCLAEDRDAQAAHSMLLTRLMEEGEPSLIPPNSGSADASTAGNPTEYLLVVGPLVVDNRTIGLVEILQRTGSGPTTQRGYLRFLMRMCEIASDHLRDQRLRLFNEQQNMWQQLEAFIREVHSGLDLNQTVYTIANEGRRLIDSDRVSVALSRGRRCRIKAVSGLDSIERRADQVKLLGDLATRIVATGRPLWYSGDDSDLPPQIEKTLQEYVDKSHTKMLAIVPLVPVTADENEEGGITASKDEVSNPRPLGALIVEQLKDSRLSETTRKRIEVVVNHSRTAMTNASDHNSIFLLPLWKLIGKISDAFRGKRLLKTAGILGAVGAAIMFLCFYPWEFTLSSRGQLIPETQREVFVQVDGVLDEVLVPEDPDEIVGEGQLLARMSNNDLQAEIEYLEGELRRLDQEMATLERSKFENQEGLDRIVLAGQHAEAVEEYKSIDYNLRLKLADARQLEIYSPIQGQVINWQLRQNLLRRPVVKGQNIMTVVDPDANWVVELEMPERRIAHVMNARRESESDEPLQVTFALASHPGTEFRGTVQSMDRRLDVHSDEGNTMLVRVAFDRNDLPEDLLRSGTRVTAQIHCGEASIGYVYLHELFETVHSTFLLWF